MKKQNHKYKSTADLYDKSEGGHYYRRFKTNVQRKANNALDKALRQKDISKILGDDKENDFYYY